MHKQAKTPVQVGENTYPQGTDLKVNGHKFPSYFKMQASQSYVYVPDTIFWICTQKCLVGTDNYETVSPIFKDSAIKLHRIKRL